ncbi:MAG: hydrogenase maturation protease [Candidatus Lokiarchaeota archaeon]|nr:hydrogenase maturation protease [Candidatus Lokiarchaeota archaeon]
MTDRISDSVIENLTEKVKNADKILVLGIGEVNMADDGFGPYISTHFHENKKSNEKVLFINGKTNYIDRKREIIGFNPDLILILDTCESGNPPGTVIFADEQKMVDWVPISSHVIPIQIFTQTLRNELPNMEAYLLGVNPFSLEPPEERDLYRPKEYELDDYDNDPDLPFYAFNMTEKMLKISNEVIKILEKILEI